ncbi:ABC-2 family transporter protein [Lactobacillus mulieris]|uniref:ABC transporter permease n=1 Tax=Lactobacillus mulieris TaxID=2508708 RepID=UPI001432A0D5|nr:ABC-2 family transporter protein [Lactobacillus mulieris]MCF1783300.1 ABC-2 family transporter protein [Lactobacillus mulieris]MCW8104498.1 ABC-2 family transporter protein [Lactobacillus mulieris]MDK6802945.1 ABC-2 family transporter protein [Lactobacillus mulieris]MDK8382061.1 ABC-2 family transporter protein [Lactobacillus mulieris]MDT9620277.1 ABC-2 family transporter protein [Lactobacillus mulieris]
MKQNILISIWKQSLKQFLIYRSTSLITFLLALIFLVIQLLIGDVYFGEGIKINGWSKEEYFILITFCYSAEYLYNFFFVLGHENMSEAILNGELDYALIRPISSYWYIVGTNLDIPSFFNFLVSYGLLLHYLSAVHTSWLVVIEIFFYLLCAALFLFFINQICICLTFWFDGLTAVYGMIEDLWDFASRPKTIFPRAIQNLFIFIFPVLIATNLPLAFAIQHHWGSEMVIYFLFSLIVLYFISKIVWEKGLKHYASSN